MSRNVGLAIMSILAESCAGTQKRLVTDQTNSYRLLARSIAAIQKVPDGQASADVERLVTIAVKVLDPDQFTLGELIELREQELKKPGKRLRKMRHNFMNHIDAYVKRIAACQGDTADIREIERQYEEDVRDDLQELKDSLKRSRTDALLSKEFGIGTIATVGSSVVGEGFNIPALTMVAGVAAVGTLVSGVRAYQAKRRDALSKHAMSWLLMASRRGTLEWY
jgi:hypothetical protein